MKALRARVGSTLRWLRSPDERARQRQVASDYADCRDRIRALSAPAPANDRGRVVWLISSFSTVWGYKMEGVLSLALRGRGFQPRIVYLFHDAWGRRYHSLFGLTGGVAFAPALSVSAEGEAAAAAVLAGLSSVAQLLALENRGVAVGRIALSNYLNRNKFTALDLKSSATLADLAADLRVIDRNITGAMSLIDAGRPSLVLLLEKGVSPMAELFGAAVVAGVPVVQYAGAQRTDTYALKRYTRANLTAHPFSLAPDTWQTVKAMPWSPAQDQAIIDEITDGYRNGTWFNRKFLQVGKVIKSEADVRQQLGLDPSKKTAVIFSHVLWDATFFYGDGLFEDYETWLVETVKAAAANPRLNWVVKIHPDLVWKLKYEGVSGELRDLVAMRAGVGGLLPSHIIVVPPDTDISTYSFFDITDYCITVRGTIGMEMACHGVPVITGGTGRYSGLGFTVDSSTAAEYLGRLASLAAQPPMTPDARELARRYAFVLFHERPWPLTSFRTVRASLDRVGDALDTNMHPQVSSYAELAKAKDLTSFAAWVDSEATDYLCAAL